ncbi:peroxisomal membrane 22 kDa family protein [Striga asiatica]|uniref:Peroxisomal membrane 22 kDa family protein n=1 Tax=Striga asiatica TaxID=4170 RepID=A0A5A7RH26_STRAF|nr:peroxisomal membrane 22 kDa family protein [Striga asiatica]
MATAVTPQSFLSLSTPKLKTHPNKRIFSPKSQPPPAAAMISLKPNYRRQPLQLVKSVAGDLDQSDECAEQQGGVVCMESEAERSEVVDQVVGGFGSESAGMLSFDGAAGFSSSASGVGGPPESGKGQNQEKTGRLIDRAINATIVLAAGSFAITKLLTIDHEYWQGWTLFEILRYAPQHNWSAYEEALKTNPVFAKMIISGVVYSVGDWIAQCYEGKPIFEFDRARMFRSGLLGFTLHGSLSHYYYQFCEALFPFDDWWVVPAKVIFDQTAWSAVWNSIYYTLLGMLRLESPVSIYSEWKATFWPMLTAGWKLWPFAHLVTYGVIPVEQRLLWVDCVELIWVTILSTYSNEKSEARISEVPVEDNQSLPPSQGPPEVFRH